MNRTNPTLATVLALAFGAGLAACTPAENSEPAGPAPANTGKGGTGGTRPPQGGQTSGGSTGASGGATGSTGGATGSTGGSTGSTGGSTGSTGGSAGSGSGGAGGSTDTASPGGAGGGSAGAGGSDAGTGGGETAGPPSAGGKLVLTVTGFTMMGTRNCYPPGSNSMGNKSPKLDWGPTPAGTKWYVLSTEDITGRSVHQIVCKIMPDVTGQPADVKAMVPPGAEFGVGHGNKASVGWYGPGAGGAARNYSINIWALAADLPMSCKADPKGALAYLKTNKANKAIVLDTDGKDFWGNVGGSCN